jgi:PDDEXK-like domain of unknown function (DUF3799)
MTVIPPFITEPGIYDMPDLVYHSDPVVPAPSLSRSIGRLLIEASPAHAYVAHPRLGGAPPKGAAGADDDDTGGRSPATGDDDRDIGTAAHAMFLEGVNKIELIPVHSYSKNSPNMKVSEAKALRDAAMAEGKIPLKIAQHAAAMNVYERLEEFRSKTGLFTKGKPEQTLIWNEGDLWCRARVDWLPDDPAAPLLDLKTTGGLATVATWGRRCFEFGADMQGSMYPRGCEFLRGEAPDGVLFVVVETKKPFGIRVFGLDPIALEIGQAKCQASRAVWKQCLAAERWPGYQMVTEWILPPPWVVRQWEETRVGGVGRAVEDTAFIEKMIRLGNWGG